MHDHPEPDHPSPDPAGSRPLRVGSLFSGYGGLDLAVEEVFDAQTVWFSEVNEPVARVFSRHWPGVPNLGDIAQIDWNEVPPVDLLIGGFPCQDVSTVGKRAGLAPGTRSGLWSHMATAIDALRPSWVVIENVRGLLSAPAVRATPEGDDDDRHDTERNPRPGRGEPDQHATPDATPGRADRGAVRGMEPDLWGVADEPARPLRAIGAVLGDLADLGYDAAWAGIPASLVGAPHTRFRVFILAWPEHTDGAAGDDGAGGVTADPAGLRQHSRQRTPVAGPRPARDDHADPPTRGPVPPPRLGSTRSGRGTVHPHTGLPHNQRRDTGARRPGAAGLGDPRDLSRRWGRYATAIARWEHATGRPVPVAATFTTAGSPKPNPLFVEWLMGLPEGLVTDSEFGLTLAEQLTALGNGVMPAQAAEAIERLLRHAPDA